MAAIILLIGHLFLGLYFLHSSLGKFLQIRAFIEGVRNYQVVGSEYAGILGRLIPIVELGLAIGFLLSIYPSLVLVTAGMLVAAFLMAISVNLGRGREIECNCFGIASTKFISWATIARNFIILLIILVMSNLTGFTLSLQDGFFGSLAHNNAESILLIGLLVAFLFVSTSLLEWTVDITLRVSRLGNSNKLAIGGTPRINSGPVKYPIV